jgi:alkylation response protein AidB-like acyl-CoA dehydrogenase
MGVWEYGSVRVQLYPHTPTLPYSHTSPPPYPHTSTLKMDFELTEDQKLIQQTVREFVQKEVAPYAAYYDEREEFPEEIFRKLALINFFGIIFPEEWGGVGADYVTYALAMEELAAADGSVALSALAHISLCSNHIYLAGNEEQKRKYLVPLIEGKLLGAWGLTEPNSGSDAKSLRTTAVLDGSEWVLNGSKMFTTQGTVCDVAVVMAITDKTRGHHGISAFLVERGTPGFSSVKLRNKLGMRGSDTAELIFENCRIPRENLLGQEGHGFIDSLRVLEGGRIGISALAVGIGRAALEESIKYSKQRIQFGRPIADFQAIQWMLADSEVELEAARMLTLRAAYLKDRGLPIKKEASMAKLYSSRACVRAVDRAVQIHGGYGYIGEYPVSRYYRDAKLCEIGEGTSEIHRMVIANQLLKE